MSLRTDQQRFWILELSVFGRPERFATLRFTIDTEDGGEVVVREGLQDFSLTKGSGDVAELAAPIAIAADDLEGVAGSLELVGGWAGLYAAGYDLERQPAKLLRWTPGTLFERAEVVLRGVVEELSIGGPLEPLEFTLARSPVRESRPMIGPAAKADSETWPVALNFELDENIVGAWYPLVIGAPGSHVVKVGGSLQLFDTPRVPGLLVEDFQGAPPVAKFSKVLIAGHPVSATEVRLHEIEDLGNSPSDLRPVFETQDKLGRTVSVVDYDGSSLNQHEPGRNYYTSWSDTNGRGGGLPRVDGSGAVRGLGEVLRRLLELFSDLEVDGPAMESERTFLDAFKIDTYVNEPLDVWSWIQAELFQLVPLKVVEGPNGIWIRLMRYQATLRDAKLYLDAEDPRISRATKLTSTGWDQVANELRLDFAANRNAPNFTRHRVISGSPDPADPNAFFDYRCGVSERKLERPERQGSGKRTLVLGGGAHLWEAQTVDSILRLKAAQLAIPHKVGLWTFPESLEEQLEPADVVAIRDPEVGVPDYRAALVDDVTIGEGVTRARLIVLEDPARIDRVFRA